MALHNNKKNNLRWKSFNHVITPCHKSKCYHQGSIDCKNTHKYTCNGINKCQ